MKASRWRARTLAAVAAVVARVALGQEQLALGDVTLEASGATQAALEAALANQALYLQTFINGTDTGLITPYVMVGGALYADADELRQLGLNVAETRVGRANRIELTRIPGLTYRLDALRGVLEITVGADQLTHHRYDGGSAALRPEASPGVLLNYDLYAQETHTAVGDTRAENYSGFFDLRGFAQIGSLVQTGIVRHNDPEPADYRTTLRLDTTLQHSDLDRLDTWRAGDLISGANLSWTTPVRLGGVQWQRNFHLQPNLVTFPVPTIQGAAAVPSTVDVLVNNVQQYSQAVQPGPFTIENMPVITGQGEIRVVVRDAQGREQVTTMPFYASASLLKPGMIDHSIEAGYLRRNYAVVSNDYDSRPAALGSVRAGVTDWLTLEGHAEGSDTLANGGVGGVFGLGSYGVLSASFAESQARSSTGTQWSAAYQWYSRYFGVSASTQRSTATYQNLSSMSLGAAPSREVSQASASTPLFGGGLSLGYVQVTGASLIAAVPGATSPTTRLGTLSYSTSLGDQLSVYASVFREFETDSNGASIGVGYFFGQHTTASAAMDVRDGRGTASLQVTQPVPTEGTGAGWRVQGNSGENGQLSASAGYRGATATVEAGAADANGSDWAFGSMRGSIVSLDYRRWPMLSNPISNSFALVDTGAPNVGVLYENRPAGRSNGQGLLLLTNLTAQSRNQIAIDARDVPLDAEVSQVREVTVPLDHSGVMVKFPVARTDNLTVTLRLPDGSPVPLGSALRVNGSEEYIVGYDGEAFVRGLKPYNHARVYWDGGACDADFAYDAKSSTRKLALHCRPEAG